MIAFVDVHPHVTRVAWETRPGFWAQSVVLAKRQHPDAAEVYAGGGATEWLPMERLVSIGLLYEDDASSAKLAAAMRAAPLDRAIATIVESLKSGGTVYTCGNGGSDAHAGHLAAELIGRFAYDRPPLRAVHLSSGGPVGSCIANDYGWEGVFSRQVAALTRPAWSREPEEGAHHVLVCFTTSGKSKNIIRAIHEAQRHRAATVAFTGPSGLTSDYGNADALEVRADAFTTAMIQEEHQRMIHEVARRVEEALCPR